MSNEPSKNPTIRWDTSLNLGNMLQLVVLLVTVVLAYSAFDKRTTILEMQFVEMKQQMQAVDERTQRMEKCVIRRDMASEADEERTKKEQR